MLNDFKVCKGDVDSAIRIMQEVAEWCEKTGRSMWRIDMLSRDILLQGLQAENFYVGKVGNDNAATMILQWQDSLFWPQINKDDSGFIHKLCVRRIYSGQGLSGKMVAYAIEECKKKGIKYLRLDTGWRRRKLCNLYESLGFVKVGKKTIDDMDYALYEMRII